MADKKREPLSEPADHAARWMSLRLIMVITASFIIGSMIYLMMFERHITEVDGEMLMTSEHMIGDMSMAHLWLEEVLTGDPAEHAEKSLEHLALVEHGFEKLIVADGYTDIFFSHQELAGLHELLAESQDTFKELKELGETRLKHPELSGVGTVVDQHYDAAFKHFVSQLNDLEQMFQITMKEHQDHLQISRMILILCSLLLMIAAGWMVTSSMKAQQRSFDKALAFEREVRAVEERTHVILENALDAVITIDHEGKVLSWNREAAVIFGWSEQETIGRPLSELIVPSRYQGGHREALQRVVSAEVTELAGKRTELIAHRRNGEEFPVELSVIPYAMDDKHYFTAFIRDVSEQVKTEQGRRENVRRLNEAQEIAGIGSWELDLVADELTWSDQTYRIFEIDKNQFGASYEAFLDAIHPDDREKVNKAYTDSLETREPYEVSHRLLMKDGRIKYVQECCESYFDDERGIPLRSIGTVQDVTALVESQQRREAERGKMEHVQRLESLGVLAGGIAHDFNNILTSLLGNAGLAINKLPDTSPAHEYLKRIISGSHKAADLCKQMLAYSGKGKFVVKPINLSELVEEMNQLLKVTVAKNIVLRLDLDKQIPAIDADVTQMQQVIMNLVINASEAIGEKSGAISIATGVTRVDEQYLSTMFLDERLKEGRYVYLEVSDTGCGMDKATKEKLFEPFFTTKFAGRGLGMAAILGIIRGHRGAIKVYTELGKGTTFKVLFPCSDQAPVPLTEEQKRIAAWHGDGAVLIVDDEESIREVASAMLENLGIEPLTAADGVEGVEMFKQHHERIRVVLLDMTMPKMNGEDAFSEMCRIDPEVKVILSSGYNEQDATNRFAGKGLAGFLQKPYSEEELTAKLSEIFNKT